MADPEQAQEKALARLEAALERIAAEAEPPRAAPKAVPADPILHEIAAGLDAMIVRLRAVLAAESG